MPEFPLTNSTLRQLSQKPAFLNAADEENLLSLIEQNRLEDFYELGAKLIKNSYNVAQLYLYLFSKIQDINKVNPQFLNHVCWRAFNAASTGWLLVYDPEIVDFCLKYASDKQLVEEAKNANGQSWFHKYAPFVVIEKNIQAGTGDLEQQCALYHAFLRELFSASKIDVDEYDKALDQLRKETTIRKGDVPIGSLISTALQEQLEFKIILPTISLPQVLKRPT
jgi:hypothetical protein